MRSPLVRVAFVMVGVLAVAAGQNPQLREASLWVGSAIIGDLKGQVALRSPQGAPLTPQRGLTLAVESVIETTKGAVLLNLQDGSQVLVKPHSRVVLKSPTQGKGYFLELWLGKILAQVQKRFGSSPSFKMGTPTAVITVRGTRFSVEVTKKKKTVVDVYEGLVAVAGFGAEDQPVLIEPGYWTEVGGGGKSLRPAAPREMLTPDYRTEMEPGRGSEDTPFGAWSGGLSENGQSGERPDQQGSENERESSPQTTPTKPSSPPPIPKGPDQP